MTPSELFRNWFAEVWNGRRPDLMEKFITEESLFHSVNETGGPLKGASGFRPFMEGLLAAFPDIRFDVRHVIEDGDFAAGRWVAQMTHTGHGMGLEPTNKPITLTGMAFIRVADGKVVEIWDEWNRLGLFTEIGAVAFTRPLSPTTAPAT